MGTSVDIAYIEKLNEDVSNAVSRWYKREWIQLADNHYLQERHYKKHFY